MARARLPRPPAVLGAVVAFPPSGFVTARSEGAAYPPEGTVVQDDRGLLTGRVIRVFGPTSRPYWSVKSRRPLSPAEAAMLLGRSLTSA